MTEIAGITARLKVEADTSGLVTGSAVISATTKQIRDEFTQVDASTNKSVGNLNRGFSNLGNQLKSMGRNFRFQKGGIQQLGYQIQDVAVMSQFGADKFVILGSQGSQIASLFGPGGAVFGAVLALSAAIGGTLVKSLMSAKDKAKELPADMMKRLEAIKAKFEEVNESSKSAFTGVEVGKLNIEYDALLARIVKQKALADSLKGQTGPLASMASSARDEIKNLEGQAANLALLIGKVGEMSFGRFAADSGDVAMDDGQEEMTKRLTNVKKGIESEQYAIETFRKTRQAVIDGMYSDEQAAAANNDIMTREKIDSNLDATLASLEEERRMIGENQVLTDAEKLARMEELGAIELSAKQLHNMALLAQNEKFHGEMTDIEKKAFMEKLKLLDAEKQAKQNAVSSTFSNLATLMNSGSKKLFEIGKASAIAGAIVDGYAAVSKTMASVPYPFNIPLAIAQGAASAVQIQGIAKQKVGGAQSMGATQSFSGGMPVTNTGQQQQTQNVDVYLSGDNFSRGGIAGLIGTINDYIGDGGTKIRVN